MDKVAFIIGNGESRRHFPLDELKGVAPIFGCNALYREFMPDYLVSVDDGMRKEIEQSDFPKDRYFPANIEDQYEPAACNPGRPRNNAGMYAMKVAIEKGFDTLICLGFDFIMEDQTLSVSNLYHGTKNYGMETRARVQDNPNRLHYLTWFAQNNPECKFIFAIDGNFPTVKINAKNIFTITHRILKINIHKDTI